VSLVNDFRDKLIQQLVMRFSFQHGQVLPTIQNLVTFAEKIFMKTITAFVPINVFNMNQPAS
jgi:hypothetical protein